MTIRERGQIEHGEIRNIPLRSIQATLEGTTAEANAMPRPRFLFYRYFFFFAFFAFTIASHGV
jgi:hypothetical protein